MSDPGNQTPSPSPWIPPSVAELQAMLPRYQVKELWGRGGMGAVYRGRQENLRRAVAIKVLARRTTHGDSDSDADQYARRFKREARSMANLDHPAILSVHDFGETDSGLLYIVMEFIDGMDIHAYLQHYGGKLPERHAVAITAHVLDALQYAHEHGVVHRDIKPSNVLINSEGRVKVADFGLAKELGKASGEGGAAPLTMDGTVMGTLDFIPPEALEAGRQTDGRADLYAVGVMLYQLLTGKLPRGLFKYPAEMMPELDARFDDIIIKALQANPDDRYASATAFRNDLDELLSQPIPLAADPRFSATPVAKLAAQATPASKAKTGNTTAGHTLPKPAEMEKSKLPLYVGGGLVAALLVLAGIQLAGKSGPGKKGSPDLAQAGRLASTADSLGKPPPAEPNQETNQSDPAPNFPDPKNAGSAAPQKIKGGTPSNHFCCVGSSALWGGGFREWTTFWHFGNGCF